MAIYKLFLGTVQFGLDYGINNALGKPKEAEVFDILNHSFSSNIKTLDTADAYGNASNLIGKFISESKKVFDVNTKFSNNNSMSIASQLQNSLLALKCENIDVYFYHKFSNFIDFPNSKYELLELKETKRINKIGISIYTNQEFETAINTDFIDVIQIPFNVLDNQNLRGELIDYAKQNNKTIQVRSVFLQGLFFKPINLLSEYFAPLKKYILQLQHIAKENNIATEALALSYVLSNNKIDKVLIGVDSLQHLKTNLLHAQTKISPQIIAEINAIKVVENELLNPQNWK